MEKRKDRRSANELATVKAAAWAWYQHGSGSDGKLMSEFNTTTIRRRSPTPSLFKLEAMRKMVQSMKELDSCNSVRSNGSLFDDYEIDSIFRQLGFPVESSGSRIYSDRREIGSSPGSGMKKNEMKKMKKLIGFWQRHAVICGTRNDVADSRVFGSSRRLEKFTPVSGMSTCRPRITHE